MDGGPASHPEREPDTAQDDGDDLGQLDLAQQRDPGEQLVHHRNGHDGHDEHTQVHDRIAAREFGHPARGTTHRASLAHSAWYRRAR